MNERERRAELALRAAVERLYAVFARYPLPIRLRPCSHGVALRWIAYDAEQALYVRPLRDLTAADLHAYAQNAVTTWGDAFAFQHFLPWLLELIALDVADTFTPGLVASHIAYAGWRR